MATLERALALVEEGDFDAAILDITIRGGKVYPVAEALLKRGIPFVFASGYGDWALPKELRDKPRLMKPFTGADLAGQLKFLYNEAEARRRRQSVKVGGQRSRFSFARLLAALCRLAYHPSGRRARCAAGCPPSTSNT